MSGQGWKPPPAQCGPRAVAGSDRDQDAGTEMRSGVISQGLEGHAQPSTAVSLQAAHCVPGPGASPRGFCHWPLYQSHPGFLSDHKTLASEPL